VVRVEIGKCSKETGSAQVAVIQSLNYHLSRETPQISSAAIALKKANDKEKQPAGKHADGLFSCELTTL